MVKAILLIVLGFILLIKGADFLVDGASDIAKKLHIPEIIIGLTIVSIGTSMPELFVSTKAALEGSADISLGNIIGSNICNLLLILGLSAFIKPVKFQKETIKIEIPMCLGITILFFILCNTGKMLSRVEGILFLHLFLMFILYTIYMGTQGDNKFSFGREKKISLPKSILLLLLGIVGLKYGGDFTVDNAVYIAQRLNISEKIISMTVLAIGTSLPELVTSVTAAIKGDSDIAIGNIIGSNIFNILLIIGLSAAITPLTYNVSYNIQMFTLMFAMILLAIFPFIKPKNVMSRFNGLVYLIAYIGYMIVLFII